MNLVQQPPRYVAGCPKLCFTNDFITTVASAFLQFEDAEPNVTGEMFTITGIKFTVGPNCDLTNALAATNAANLVAALNSHPDFFQRAIASVVSVTDVLIVAYVAEFQPNWTFDFSGLSFPPVLSQNPGANSDAPIGYRMHYQLFVENRPYGPMASVPVIYKDGSPITQCFEYRYPLMPEPLITNGIAKRDYEISRSAFIRYGDSQRGVACGSDFGIFQVTNTFNLVFGDSANYGGVVGEWPWLDNEQAVLICNNTIESRWIILALEHEGYDVIELAIAYDFYDSNNNRTTTYVEAAWTGDGVYQIPLSYPIAIPEGTCYWHVFVGARVVAGLGSSTIYPALGRVVRVKDPDCKCVAVWYLDNGWKQMILDVYEQMAITDSHELLEIAADCEACANKIARKELSENFTLLKRGYNFPEFRAGWYRFLASDRYLIHGENGFEEVYLRPGETVVYQKDTAYFITIRFDR